MMLSHKAKEIIGLNDAVLFVYCFITLLVDAVVRTNDLGRFY